jgi:type IV pilus assembly protein PilB
MARLKLGELLIERGLIHPDQLEVALTHQQRWNKRLGKCLLDLNFIKEKQLYEILAKSLKVPIIDLTRIRPETITRDLLKTIPQKVARANRVVPLSIQTVRRRERLIVATPDPLNYGALEQVRYTSPLPLFVMIAPESDLDWFIDRYYSQRASKGYISVVKLKKIGQNDQNLNLVEGIFDDSLFGKHNKTHRPKKD